MLWCGVVCCGSQPGSSPAAACARRHPEKNAFEWTPDKDIPHHPDAIEVTQVHLDYRCCCCCCCLHHRQRCYCCWCVAAGVPCFRCTGSRCVLLPLLCTLKTNVRCELPSSILTGGCQLLCERSTPQLPQACQPGRGGGPAHLQLGTRIHRKGGAALLLVTLLASLAADLSPGCLLGGLVFAVAAAQQVHVALFLSHLLILLSPFLPLLVIQHRYKGQEVDFVESYFFPPAKELEAQLQQRRQHRSAAEAAVERA